MSMTSKVLLRPIHRLVSAQSNILHHQSRCITETSGPPREIKAQKTLQIPPNIHGVEVMYDPFFNKGTAFTEREKDRFGLRGLVPSVNFTIDQQVERVYQAFHAAGHTSPEAIEAGRHEDDIAKYSFLSALQDRNETLFYRLLTQHIEELAPFIYTPTVGKACQQYYTLFRRPRGMYITANDVNDMHAIMQNWPRNEVDVVVVTDGSRILGLGDLGVQGMAIPIGKLALYVAAGGIDPTKCLPVMLDVGTNNQKLLDDPFYMGLRHHRLPDDQYFEVVDQFMTALYARFPKALVQFEDFKTPRAEQLLNRYRNVFTTFNDDMQGTGVVVLAGLLAAMRRNQSSLTKAKIVCVGAGSAGLGVCNMLVDAMVRMGLSRQEAYSRFWLTDDKGLITAKRGNDLQHGQGPFARYDASSLAMEGADLVKTIEEFKPNVLLGLAGAGGLFTEEVVKSVASYEQYPIIFAMSNPTHLSECTAEQAYEWTDGRVTFASGSPFAPVNRIDSNGNEVIHHTSQANNMFAFPGIGMGVVASQSKNVSDHMFYVAARRLADSVTEEDLRDGKVFPRIPDIRDVSLKIAVSVATVAQEDGIARHWPQDRDWNSYIKNLMWQPEYRPLVRPRMADVM